MRESYETYRRQIAGKRVALVGFGISNRAAVDFLLGCGAVLSVRDGNANPSPETLAFLAERQIPSVFGGDYLKNIDEDVVYKSPGIRFDEPDLLAAASRGTEITSEMEVFCRLCPCRIYAVTGSDGKTTTTTLISEMLKKAAARKGTTVFTGGNIGTPLLPFLPQMRADDFVVLELSSFQLHTMHFSPDVAVVTNVTPNHLNWHTSMDEYIESKENVFRGQRADGRLVLNAENEITAQMAARAPSRVTRFSSAQRPRGERACWLENEHLFYEESGERTRVMDRADIRIVGTHNVENYLAAIAAVSGEAEPSEMREVARTFAGVRHRIELVAEKHGVRYFNNSIGTSPARTVAALSCFDTPLVVIVGGYDKHIPVEPMLAPLSEKARFVVGTGQTGEAVLAALIASGYPAGQVHYEASFDDAVRYAADLARDGDTVLLSPAAASFDVFPNFEARGDRFTELVNQIK